MVLKLLLLANSKFSFFPFFTIPEIFLSMSKLHKWEAYKESTDMLSWFLKEQLLSQFTHCVYTIYKKVPTIATTQEDMIGC